jgi:hypothetical protein
MAYWRGSEAPLEKEKEWVSQMGMRERHDTVEGIVVADKAGTLFIDQSGDGKNWDFSNSFEISASVGKGFSQILVAPYWRVRFKNTTNENQGVFRIWANTQAGGDS